MRTKVAHYPLWLGLLLSPGVALAQAKAGSLPAAPPAPKKAETAKPDAQPAAPKAATKPPPAKPDPKPATKVDAKPEPKAEPKPAAKAEPKPDPEPKAKPAPSATPKPEPKSADAELAPDAIPADTGKPAADVARGSGARSVSPAPSDSPEPSADEPEKKPTSSSTHKKGRPPAKPSPSLPTGVPRAMPDESARQHITSGTPTDDAIKRGKDDPELNSLREAERVLFPRPLTGLELGFDFAPTTSAAAEVDASGLPAGAVSSGGVAPAQTDAGWLRTLSQPDLPIRFDERVVRYLRFYRDTPSGRSIARTWTKKSGRFAPAIKTELSRAGLPTDLVWLSLIESSHNPTIASPVGAAGLWQFMPDAARSYGLTVDRWVDERLDPERSTQAALRYLSDLYRRFGSWELAMAAYNMGYGGLSRSVRKFNTNDFWELARFEAGIPWETTLYVPKILATAIVMNNRRAFGIDGVSEDAPERFDSVVVGPSVPLSEIARAVSATPAVIESLNPQFLAGRTPPAAPGAPRSSYRVRVPAGSGGNWNSARAPSDDGLESYVVRAGETVERIARARGSSERDLREKNRVAADEVLAPGTVLLVPKLNRTQEPDPTTNAEVVVVPARAIDYPERKRVFYRVVSGDTAAGVAAAFKVSLEQLADWNAVDPQARLEPGMSLQVFVAKDADLSKVLHIPEAHARLLVAGSPEFCAHFEGQNGKNRLVIAARDGDTLTSIGKRYGMTVGQMERVNRRGRSDQLAVGDRVVVYTERAQPAPGDSLMSVNN